MIMAELPEWEIPSSYEVLVVPKMTWAVMTETKPIQERMDVQPLWKRLPEFFEATGYEHAEAPGLEQYSHNETHRFGEIWVPIIKK